MSDLDYSGDSADSHDSYRRGSATETEGEYEDEPDDVRSDNVVGSGVTPTLQLCSAHKPGQMVEVCKTCAAALSMVRPEVAKQLIAPVTVTALTRYSTRSDEKPPSLFLPSGIIELAENTFNAGMFRGRSHWNELVQKFLCLPPDQHNRLVKDLQPEQMFRKMESEARFKYIFQFRKDLGDCLKNLRISQRLIFCMVDTIDTHIPVLRGLGMAAGLTYSPVAPSRTNPAVPKVLEDSLAVAGSDGLLPLPGFSDILAGVSGDLTELDKAKIKANWCVVEDEMTTYAESARQHYMALYNAAAVTSNRLDDFLNFYCDVYGHNDACFRDLIRGKLVNLFKTEFRSELFGKHLSVEDRKMVKETGLLGGEEKVRAVLGDLTKSDELLKKAVIPRRSQTDKRSQGSNAGTLGNSRSKSPDNRHNRNNRNKNYGGKGQKRGSRGSGGTAKKAKLDHDFEDESSPPSKDKRKSSGNSRGKNNSKKE